MSGYAREYLDAATAMFEAMGASDACQCAASALADEIDRQFQAEGWCGPARLQARAAEFRVRTRDIRAEDRARKAKRGAA
ncbi:hypothetical protein [Thioalkalivibrio sp. ALgr3]|uniref:hypothetical protein n=1 Tax=Thioalkalivibrio sp. ALgr3 TaxID=1239292 RepID=UPI0003770C53|nr:hypothetical protein [Thioalkalivibrio sp. ALgr3]